MDDALERAMVTLSFADDNLDLQEITDLLGGTPRLAVLKGEKFVGQGGILITAKTGKWLFGGDWETDLDVGIQIKTLFAQLTQDLDIWRSVTGRFGGMVHVGGYFDGWTGGLTLEPDVLLLLAERGLTIDFDLYAPAASKAEDIND